jgi:hypothetical protein
MRMPIHIPVPVRCAACALALTLAACPDGTGPTSVTSTIDFDALATGQPVGAHYREAAGLQFVTTPFRCGLVCGPPWPDVPPGKEWQSRCMALPRVMEYGAAPSGRHVASLRTSSGWPFNNVSNTMCAVLDRPAGLVSFRLRDLSGENKDVNVVGVNAAGVVLTNEEWSLDPAGFSMPRIVSFGDDIAGFALYGEYGAHLVIDDVWITRPR